MAHNREEQEVLDERSALFVSIFDKQILDFFFSKSEGEL